MTAVPVAEQRRSVGALHGLDPFADGVVAEPVLWWCLPERPAVVLGSRQTPDLLDLAACADLGLEVVRRRSGGGLVLVDPDTTVWVDLVLPHGVAPDDVGGSMVWAGERWRAALGAFVEPGLLDHSAGPMQRTPWSELLCFAGLGPGEVLLDGRKLVGLSQRRTRHGLRIQGMLYTGPPAIDLIALVRAPLPTSEPPPIAHLEAADPGALVGALARSLGSS